MYTETCRYRGTRPAKAGAYADLAPPVFSNDPNQNHGQHATCPIHRYALIEWHNRCYEM